MPLRSLAVLVALTTAALGSFLVRAENPRASETTPPGTDSESSTESMILQEGDGEHRVHSAGPLSGLPFLIKLDGQNGHTQDFFVFSETLAAGQAIPFHMHDNAEEVLISEEGGATVTVGDKQAVAGPRSIVFIPRDTWISATNNGARDIHLIAVFSRHGFENYLRAISVKQGQPVTPVSPDEIPRLRALGHSVYWDTAKGPHPPGVASPSTANTYGQSPPTPLILQEDDGEHRLRRPGGPTGSSSVPGFIIKIDKQNGNAEDFYVGYEILNPGAMIPFHKHHNSEEVVILEEGGATVTVGDKRAVAGPRSIVFIPQETWVSIANSGNSPIHGYYLFSRQGFENFLRARSVRPGEPLTPLMPEEVRRAAEDGHVMPWDTSKGPYPPGVPHP
jgi:mannose-6-phosphate isomerase-like protein (cupin superfamily)